MIRKVIDENGKVYPHLKAAFLENGMAKPCAHYYHMLEMKGVVRSRGKTFTYPPNTQSKSGQTTNQDPLMAKLRERYTTEELRAIASGEGIAKRFIPFPEIHLSGTHHKILVMSDTHIGSVYSPEEWHTTVSGYANDPANGIECVLHCGDLVDADLNMAGTLAAHVMEAAIADAVRAARIPDEVFLPHCLTPPPAGEKS